MNIVVMPLRYTDQAGRQVARERASYRLWAAVGEGVSFIIGLHPDTAHAAVARIAASVADELPTASEPEL